MTYRVCSAWDMPVVNRREMFHLSRLTGMRLRAVITLQTLW